MNMNTAIISGQADFSTGQDTKQSLLKNIKFYLFLNLIANCNKTLTKR